MLFDPDDIPHINRDLESEHIAERNSLSQTGSAGEYFVAYQLTRAGLWPSVSTMMGSTDVFIETNAGGVFRCQVKTATRAVASWSAITPIYTFTGDHIKPGEYDLIACVALDIEVVAWVDGWDAPVQHFRVPGSPAIGGTMRRKKNIDQYPLEDWLKLRGIDGKATDKD